MSAINWDTSDSIGEQYTPVKRGDRAQRILRNYMRGSVGEDLEEKFKVFGRGLVLPLPKPFEYQVSLGCEIRGVISTYCVGCLRGIDQEDPLGSVGEEFEVIDHHGLAMCIECSQSKDIHWILCGIVNKIIYKQMILFEDMCEMLDLIVYNHSINGRMKYRGSYSGYLETKMYKGYSIFDLDPYKAFPQEDVFEETDNTFEVEEFFGKVTVDFAVEQEPQFNIPVAPLGEFEVGTNTADVFYNPQGSVHLFPCLDTDKSGVGVYQELLDSFDNSKRVLIPNFTRYGYGVEFLRRPPVDKEVKLKYSYVSSSGRIIYIGEQSFVTDGSSFSALPGFKMKTRSDDELFYFKKMIVDYQQARFGVIMVEVVADKIMYIRVRQKYYMLGERVENKIWGDGDLKGYNDTIVFSSLKRALNGYYIFKGCETFLDLEEYKSVEDKIIEYGASFVINAHNAFVNDKSYQGRPIELTDMNLVNLVSQYHCYSCYRWRSLGHPSWRFDVNCKCGVKNECVKILMSKKFQTMWSFSSPTVGDVTSDTIRAFVDEDRIGFKGFYLRDYERIDTSIGINGWDSFIRFKYWYKDLFDRLLGNIECFSVSDGDVLKARMEGIKIGVLLLV